MPELNWRPMYPKNYILDEDTTVGGTVCVERNEGDCVWWRGVVTANGKDHHTDWLDFKQAIEAVQTLMKEHGVTVKESESSFPAETPESEPLTIDEYMYQREANHASQAEYYRDFGFVPFGATRSDGVAVNAERNAGQPSVAMRIISSLGLFLYGKQRLPESVFLSPDQAHALAGLLMDYANAAETEFEAEYKEAKRSAAQKVDKLRQQNADANPA